MDWIHCNQCFNQPRNSSPRYVLTSCGHIFCEVCENRENIDCCKACKSPCKTITLSANMRPDILFYFDDLEEMAKRLLRTIRFQRDHRFNLLKNHMKINEKYVTAKNHIRKLEAQYSSMRKTLERCERSRAITSSQTPELYINSNIHRKNSPLFNGIHNQKSAKPEKTNFPFRVPDIHAYQRYSTTQGNRHFPRAQLNHSMRTPLYNDFRGMRMAAARRY